MVLNVLFVMNGMWENAQTPYPPVSLELNPTHAQNAWEKVGESKKA